MLVFVVREDVSNDAYDDPAKVLVVVVSVVLVVLVVSVVLVVLVVLLVVSVVLLVVVLGALVVPVVATLLFPTAFAAPAIVWPTVSWVQKGLFGLSAQ